MGERLWQLGNGRKRAFGDFTCLGKAKNVLLHHDYSNLTILQAHHMYKLTTSASRAVRFQAANLQNWFILEHSTARDALLEPQILEIPSYLGSWCLSAFDGDKGVRALAQKSWNSVTNSSESISANASGLDLGVYASTLIEYLASIILNESDENLPSTLNHDKRTAVEELEAQEDQRGDRARILVAALEALQQLISMSSFNIHLFGPDRTLNE